jgi:hypothetical protein
MVSHAIAVPASWQAAKGVLAGQGVRHSAPSKGSRSSYCRKHAAYCESVTTAGRVGHFGARGKKPQGEELFFKPGSRAVILFRGEEVASALLSSLRRGVSLEFAIKGLAVEAEDLGGEFLVAAHRLEDSEHVAVFDLFHGQELGRVVADDQWL